MLFRSVLMNMGEYDRAEGILRGILDRDPEAVPAMIRLANLYMMQEKYEQAESIVRDALWLANGNPTILFMQARLAIARQDYPAAIDALERIAAITPKDANVFWELGRVHQLVGELDKAEKAYLHAVELSPQHVAAMEALADLYLDQGSTEAAAAWYRRSFDAGSRSGRVCLHVATEALKQRNYEFALATLKQGVKDHPDNADLADTLARMYAMCPDSAYRNWQEAMRIAKALYGDDENKMPDRGLNTLAAIHAEAENLEEAVRLTKEGIRRAKENHDANAIRQLSENLKHYQKGKRLYESLF